MESADSARPASAGRALLATAFAGDDGAADTRLSAALRAPASGAGAEQEILAALSGARVFVAVVARSAEVEAPTQSTDIALVTLIDAAGRQALPVFTDPAALARWRPDARPVPVDGRRAGLVAGAEGADVIVIDVSGPASYVVSGRPLLEGLARGALALPAQLDPAFHAHVAAVLTCAPSIRSASIVASSDADALIHLVVEGAVPGNELAALSEALRRTPRWMVRGLAVTAGTEPDLAGLEIYLRENGPEH